MIFLKFIPHALWLLFCVYMLQNNIDAYRKHKSVKNLRSVQNIVAGLIALNLILLWGGFYDVIWQR